MYDEKLASRIRRVLHGASQVTERKMFGGIAFLDRGHMVCGVVRNELMLRVGPDAYESALAEPHVRVMTFTGRPLRGMIYVSPSGLRTANALRAWIARGLRFTRTLPDKKPKKRPRAYAGRHFRKIGRTPHFRDGADGEYPRRAARTAGPSTRGRCSAGRLARRGSC